MVMDTVYCLTPGCDFESQVASDCSSRHKAVQDGYDDWHLDDRVLMIRPWNFRPLDV